MRLRRPSRELSEPQIVPFTEYSMLQKGKKIIKNIFYADVQTDEERIHLQYLLALDILTIVSFVMTGMNIITNWYRLACITFVCGICCILDAVIERHSANHLHIQFVGRLLFILEIGAMFTLFLILGDPEGFSPIWILLLPASIFFLFGMEYGTAVSIGELVLLVVLLWTPWGNSLLQYDYTETFKMRFPVVFVAYAGIGVLFEIMRKNSRRDLQKAKESFEYMYNHDALTGLYNRYGFNNSMDEYIRDREDDGFAFAILDLDHFKYVNDKYGHTNGDTVLKEFGRRIMEGVGEDGTVCRWGGEEFSILFKSEEYAQAITEKLLQEARDQEIDIGCAMITKTFSSGIVTVKKGQKVDAGQIVRIADRNLYDAKKQGRNRIVCTTYTDEEIAPVF